MDNLYGADADHFRECHVGISVIFFILGNAWEMVNWTALLKKTSTAVLKYIRRRGEMGGGDGTGC